MATKRKTNRKTVTKTEDDKPDEVAQNDPGNTKPVVSSAKPTATKTDSKHQKEPTITPPEPVATTSFVDDLLPPEPGMKHLSTARVMLVGVALLAVGTMGFYNIPGLVNKEGDTSSSHLVNSFYCATMTLTT